MSFSYAEPRRPRDVIPLSITTRAMITTTRRTKALITRTCPSYLACLWHLNHSRLQPAWSSVRIRPRVVVAGWSLSWCWYPGKMSPWGDLCSFENFVCGFDSLSIAFHQPLAFLWPFCSETKLVCDLQAALFWLRLVDGSLHLGIGALRSPPPVSEVAQ